MQAIDLPTSPPAWCELFVGLPFEPRGRGPAAFDCYGLGMALYARRRGVALPDPLADYETTDPSPRLQGALDGQRLRWAAVARADMQELDAVAMRFQGFTCHVGWVVAEGWMIHTRQRVGVCVERYDSLLWRPRVAGIYRWQS